MSAAQASNPTLDAARAEHRAGRFAAAEALFRQVLAATPNDAHALHELGMLSYQTGRHAQAADLVRSALRVLPDDVEMQHDLGNVLEAMGDLQGALRCYHATLAREPGHADAQYNVAGVYQKLGRADDAIAAYRAAIAAAPAQADAYNNLGTVLQAQGRLSDATIQYRDAIARQPRVPVYHYNLGNALLAQGRFDDAIDAYRAALQLAPGHAATRANLGVALFARGNALHAEGRLEEAAMSFAASVAERPDYAAAHNNLGGVFLEVGHAEPALDCYRRALALDDDPAIGANFARALRKANVARDDAALRDLAARALRVPWARPGELAGAAGALLGAHPVLGPLIERGEAGAWDVLAREPLFLALLERAPVVGAAMERFVTALRRTLLARVLASTPFTDDELVLACAIARQCFVNEYVFAVAPDEMAQAETLFARLDAALAGREDPAASSVAAAAAYRRLDGLAHAERLVAGTAPGPLRAVLTQQIVEPARERSLRDALPPLTPVVDTVARRVQAQYEDNPYPRWIDLPQHPPVAFDAWLHQQMPLADLPARPGDAALDVLIAGCGTGQEALETAERHPAARVLAIDLSRASLAYAQRMTEARGVATITYAQADLVALPALGRTFDVISSVGVLHHLADPLAGWRALLACLRAGGLMQVGLYSSAARRDVDAGRAFVAARGDAPTPAGIRAARAALRADGHFDRLTALRDFHATSECRDLLFHVQERTFTFEQLGAALHGLGVELLGFVVEPAVLHAYRQAHPEDRRAVDLERWARFEQERPDTFLGMMQFWVRKPA